jgi:Tfp pilus assembly protein PilV
MRPDRPNREAGFALIETLVSAVLLVVIALALLAGADRASTTSLAGKARSSAASLAEQDQERMRSMPVTALSNYHPVARIVPVGTVNYNVTSRADWVRDTTGSTQSCTNDSTQADYLKISSTITSNVVGSLIKPVTLSSIVAPPVGAFAANQGTLAVKLTDSRNNPVVGMNVSITGPKGLSDATNAAGCAIFAYIPTGSYQVLLNAAGWVNPSNVTAVSSTQTVSAGVVNVANLQYDRAAKVGVSFETWVGGAATPSTGWGITASRVDNGTGTYYFEGAGATATPPLAGTSVDATSLWPALSGYEFYAGDCAGANPETAIPSASWYSIAPGSGDVLAPLPGSVNGVVTVRQPPLTLTVKNGASQLTSPATIVLTPADAACVKPTLTTDATGRANRTTGTPYDPGVPFGRYNVCVVGQLATTSWKKWTSATQLNVAAANGANTVPGTTGATGLLDLSLATTGTAVSTKPSCP